VDALGMEGIAVEDKRVVVTLHYRTARDPLVASGVVEGIAEDLASRHGLVVEPGRASVELRPPVPLSKGAVVRRIVSQNGLTAALFAGDDTGDLPAFQALDELAAEGLRAVKVAVRSEESPPGLLASADLVVDGPCGVLALLDELTEGAA
jgi:trehalose 6-phosphate phosphatase